MHPEMVKSRPHLSNAHRGTKHRQKCFSSELKPTFQLCSEDSTGLHCYSASVNRCLNCKLFVQTLLCTLLVTPPRLRKRLLYQAQHQKSTSGKIIVGLKYEKKTKMSLQPVCRLHEVQCRKGVRKHTDFDHKYTLQALKKITTHFKRSMTSPKQFIFLVFLLQYLLHDF